MWIEKEVTIGKSKHSAQVNDDESQIEVELSYFDKWLSCLNESMVIDGKSYKIHNMHNVGDRDETIKIVLKKGAKKDEYKSDKSRKNN